MILNFWWIQIFSIQKWSIIVILKQYFLQLYLLGSTNPSVMDAI